MVALGVLGTGCFEKSKGLKCIILFSEIFERSVGGGTLNYSLATPASRSPPPFWVFEVFGRQQRFFGAQLEVFKKKEKEGGSPLLRFAGGGQFHNCLFWRGRRDGNTTPTALPSMQP